MYQKSPLQTFAIWAGLTLIGLPLTAILTNPFNPNHLPIFALALVGWLAFWGAMGALARWLGLRTVLVRTALLLAGVPLAFLLSANNMLLYLANTVVYYSGGNTALGIFCWFLGLWSLLNGLLTRNVRGMYAAIHLSNWLFWLGIISALGGESFPLLIIPLGIMLLLLGFYKPIIQKLASLPFLQKNRQSNAIPKSDEHQDYEQGYRPSYKEGGNVYTYPYEEEVPTVYSPRAEIQQRQ